MTNTPNRLSWFAVQVRTKHEPRVLNFLKSSGYELFLPLRTSRRRWSDRIKNVETALFPGYLFCRFDPQERLPILKAPGVIQIAGYNRAPVPVDESEIRAIRALVASGLPNQPWPFLGVGDRVRIDAGPLRGHEGTLVEVKGRHRLVLSITLLQRSVAVEIDSAFVECLRSPAAGRLADARYRSLPVAV
jgi:transcription antitermination factor NusG